MDEPTAKSLDALCEAVAKAVLSIPAEAAVSAAERTRLRKAKADLVPALKEALAAGMKDEELEELLNLAKIESVVRS